MLSTGADGVHHTVDVSTPTAADAVAPGPPDRANPLSSFRSTTMMCPVPPRLDVTTIYTR